MRLLILLLVLGVGIVFFVQNQQAVTLIFFGNLARMTLPIAGWVLLFIAAGALTSLFWQLLSSLGKPSVPRNFEANRSRSYSPPPPSPQSPQMSSDYLPPQDDSRSPAQTPPSSYRSDWDSKDYQEEWDDWDVQRPAREPIIREPVRDFVREVPREPSRTEERAVEDSDRKLEEDKSTVFETEQQPKSATRTGSVYSYVYREPKDRQDREESKQDRQDKEEDNSDRVYDANYRVILPPYQNTQKQQTREDEDEEDWI
ncbi:hypothetical protein Ple7327_4578 [Pleurocapsa sp. PCC 7327]|uniref:LapA family protein n=1 Tax=Pleurocapsa sp. PCC 7327 TaxID=118163 RepID=UPI00029FD414|nr:LapA family protein [Pleurocapsa sp. PCC 7327]AFY79674.1 hypothetical protein Ple7327_4578 [Pleurocapsa sp. PCC 7327]